MDQNANAEKLIQNHLSATPGDTVDRRLLNHPGLEQNIGELISIAGRLFYPFLRHHSRFGMPCDDVEIPFHFSVARLAEEMHAVGQGNLFGLPEEPTLAAREMLLDPPFLSPHEQWNLFRLLRIFELLETTNAQEIKRIKTLLGKFKNARKLKDEFSYILGGILRQHETPRPLTTDEIDYAWRHAASTPQDLNEVREKLIPVVPELAKIFGQIIERLLPRGNAFAARCLLLNHELSLLTCTKETALKVVHHETNRIFAQ